MVGGPHWPAAAVGCAAAVSGLATVIVVCGIAAAAAYELLHTAGKKVPKCVYAATILAAVALEWVIYDEHTWQFYEGYQSMGMIRILCVPLVLVTFLFFIAVKSYGKPDAMPFADVATAIVGGIVFPLMYSKLSAAVDPEYGRMYVLWPLLRGIYRRQPFHVRRDALRQAENGTQCQPPQDLGGGHCRAAGRRTGAGTLGRGSSHMAGL